MLTTYICWVGNTSCHEILYSTLGKPDELYLPCVITGIDVGHQFFSRAEMVVVGFHQHWLNGIDFIGTTAGASRKSRKSLVSMSQSHITYAIVLAFEYLLPNALGLCPILLSCFLQSSTINGSRFQNSIFLPFSLWFCRI